MIKSLEFKLQFDEIAEGSSNVVVWIVRSRVNSAIESIPIKNIRRMEMGNTILKWLKTLQLELLSPMS